MEMFLGGNWSSGSESIDVRNPYDGSLVDTVPAATEDDVQRALETLRDGAKRMKSMPPHQRALILSDAAQRVRDRCEELARVISREEGKIIGESRVEAARTAGILEASAEEAKRVTGEMVPLSGSPGGENKLGFTIRVPCGIVAAITPFNFPLHLVAHKVGPAIAGGNAVIVKPATDTPLSALMLIECLLDAGLPPQAIACLTGPGRTLGHAICSHPAVRKISFTGSYEVGDSICRVAGMKRVTMELGSNSPVIVFDDADLDEAARVVAMNGYANAGQVCISAQRILVSEKIRSEFVARLEPKVQALRAGDPMDESTHVGPLVREQDAIRVESWINEATSSGAQLLAGGGRQGAVVEPALLDEVSPDTRISCEELFGPAVAITYFRDDGEAIELANRSLFGLSAGAFTRDIDRAMRVAAELESGNIHINWGSQWRIDTMPYGGVKLSGTGKEGPKYAVREMTEEKMVVLHLRQAADA